MKTKGFSLLLLILSLLLASCTTSPTPEPPTSVSEVEVGLPNPASVFCEERGGRLEVRIGDDGGQVGYCVFSDGSECEEWAFYRGECVPGESEPTAVPTQIEETTMPFGDGCMLMTTSEVVVYQRPSLYADVWSTLPTGDQYVVSGRTADGWLGFDPGVAQAANVGVFRLRWVEESAAITLEGKCDDLPLVVGPPAGVCFTMPMMGTTVYAEADSSSAVIVTMQPPNDFAAVIGKTADASWVKLDLSVGSMGLYQTGWIEGGLVNFNGPCENLPIIESEGGQAEPTPIIFEVGGTSASVEGQVVANGVNEYVLDAQGGQLMEVSIASPNNDVFLSIHGVSDGMPLVRAAAEQTTWRGLLPASQCYSIKAVSSGSSSFYSLFVRIPAWIRFAPGGISAVIQGYVNAGQLVDYVLYAQEGQTMSVTITSPNNNVFLSIEAIEDGIPLVRIAADATEWSGLLPGTEHYRLGAFAGGESTSYILEVTIE
jgi:putative hemolysin